MKNFIREGDVLFVTKLDRDLINERVREGIAVAKLKGVK